MTGVRVNDHYRWDNLALTLGVLMVSAVAVYGSARMYSAPAGEIAALGMFILTGVLFTHQFGIRGGPLAIGFLTLSVLIGVIGRPWEQGLTMVAGGLIVGGFIAAYAAWVHDLETQSDLQRTKESELVLQVAESQSGLEQIDARTRKQTVGLKIWASLVDVVRGCSATLKFDAIAPVILRTVESLFPGDGVSLWISASLSSDVQAEGRRHQMRSYDSAVPDGLDRMAAEQQRNIMVHNQDSDHRFQGSGQFRFTGNSALVCPLLEESRVYGNLRVTSHKSDRYDHDDMVILGHVAGVVSMSASNIRLYERTEELALTDGQTGLYKRYYFEKRFFEESKRALRKNHAMGLLLFDIDHFKKVNDTYGHSIGDMVLQEVGRILKRVDWGGALPCRWGGEEFLLALPDSTPDQARRRAETLMNQIREFSFHAPASDGSGGTDFQVTVSVGIAIFPTDTGDPDQLFQIADRRMYRAKNSGRNRYIDHD